MANNKQQQFINTSKLGIYAPSSSVHLVREADKAIMEGIFCYKQLFYGLRTVAWQNRDKAGIFYEAKAAGELDRFRVAPGVRQSDGSYSKDEYDLDRLNQYLWERFASAFNEAFGIERIQSLKSYKEIAAATKELLEAALDNWGKVLLGDAMENEAPVYSIGAGVRSCSFEVDSITIKGKFNESDRTIVLSYPGLPDVVVEQHKSTESWKGSINIDSTVSIGSAKAAVLSKMLSLASRINIGIKEFMQNPEGFLGLETAAARNRNLQLIKQRLLEVNKTEYEKRKSATKSEEQKLAEATEKFHKAQAAKAHAKTNTEKLQAVQQVIHAGEDVQEADADLQAAKARHAEKLAEEHKYQKLAGPVVVKNQVEVVSTPTSIKLSKLVVAKKDRTNDPEIKNISAEERRKQQIQAGKIDPAERRKQREQEAAEWATKHADLLSDDLDAELGITIATKSNKSQTTDENDTTL